MRICFWLVMVLLPACAATPGGGGDFAKVELAAPTPVAMDLDANLARLSEWFAGEWDNYEQVIAAREQAQGGGPPAHERVHAMFLPVNVPAIGGSVFFARQTLEDDPKRVFRLRLYRFAVDHEADAIRLDQYSFNDEKAWRDAHRAPQTLAQLSSGDLRYSPDCAVYFKFDAAAEEFAGNTRKGACKVASERLAKAVIVEDELHLGHDKLWILSSARDEAGRLIYGNPQGIPHKQRKVRYFRGWIAISKSGADASAEQRGFHTVRNVVLHSEGRVVPIVMEDGRRSGYSVQIARLSFQGDSVRALTLHLLSDATGMPVSYAWADPSSRRIGINLKWFQSDFVEIDGDSRFEPLPAR